MKYYYNEADSPIHQKWNKRQIRRSDKLEGKTIKNIFFPDDTMVIVFADNTWARFNCDHYPECSPSVRLEEYDRPMALYELRWAGFITPEEADAEEARLEAEVAAKNEAEKKKNKRNRAKRDLAAYKRLKEKFAGTHHE